MKNCNSLPLLYFLLTFCNFVLHYPSFSYSNIVPRGEPTPLQCLWLQIFTNEKLCQFSYDAIAMGRSEDIHPGGQQYREDFSCRFPFFWLIKEAIDSNWDNAKGMVV